MDEMREVPGAGMTPAGEAGEAEMASGVWSGMVRSRIYANSIY